MVTKAYKAHMQKMVEYGCMICRHFESVDDLPPCNIHHIRDKTGLGIKDKDMIPLCWHHHQGPDGIHHIGKKAWEEKYDTQRNLHKTLIEDIE